MKKSFLKIGHRGAKGYVAENTLESIQKALDFGVDGIEIDVHLCKTGELVVFHDVTMDRMTNGTGALSKKSLTEIKELYVNNQYSIPTLWEVIELIDKKCLLNIELKGKNTAFETSKIIQTCIEAKDWDYEHFIISSFQHQELMDVFETNTNIPLAVLSKASVEEAVELAKAMDAKAIHPNYALLTRDNVKFAQDLGYKVNTWTVNDDDTIQRMIAYGVDGIISDVPDRL